MKSTITVSFIVRPARKNKNGEVPIYLRVVIGGKRFDVTTKVFIDPKHWSREYGKMKNTTDEARRVNEILDGFKLKAFDYQRELMSENKPVCVENLRMKWYGKSMERPRMLMEIFEQHNKQMSALVNREFSPLTLERYETSKRHTEAFMLWKYKVSDIDIKALKYEFIADYEFWLKSERKCDHNTTVKYLSNFKKIVNICIKNGWLDRDPFFGYKMTKREIERPFLTQDELNRLSAKTFLIDRIANVRDIFLFSCYTGLAYVDVLQLTRAEITIGIDGEKWIYTSRQKTDTSTRIPLLPPALEILEKYKDDPQCINEERLLPVLSNQKMNAYLKEIADLCGITKKMTTHTARHTFATTVTLTNGVPIETVSKMLGHKNLKTTQHYAKILDKKVSEDMGVLRGKFASRKFEKLETKMATGISD
jgi:site-specific recombinase XerD